jgi:2-methylcitrate dehydratase PrpD
MLKSFPLLSFLKETRLSDLPAPVVAMARRCLLDLVGVAAAGSRTKLSRIVRDFAAAQMGAGAGMPSARLLLDGRRVSPAGAAYAGASLIDSFDAHDGHPLTKGHAGVAVLPALLAYAEAAEEPSGDDLLAMLAIGYDVAIRAGIALHATAPDYHTSGAWNALACAGLGARVLGLDAEATRHALGIAEYHGPRSQMMRCIDDPTMVKDGSGWGAFAGVSAAYLAAAGFTGAPALTVEGADVDEIWRDLGSRWRILELYFKPQPVCRWAQPAVEAALALKRRHQLDARDIAGVTVTSFHEAVRLATPMPRSTEAAQYSLPFPVAAAIVRGRVGAAEILDGLADPAILAHSARMRLVEDPAFNARFPAERWARVRFELADGRIVESEPMTARGDADDPLPDDELREKYRAYCVPLLGAERTAAIENAVATLGTDDANAGQALGILLDNFLSAP